MTINLTKGNSVDLKKSTTNATFTVRCSWSSATDYDLYAIVLYKDGHTEHVALFNAVDPDNHGRVVIPKKDRTADGAVVHQGDVRSSGGGGLFSRKKSTVSEEVIDITLNDQIDAVIPVAYSAQGNGVGSFRKYMVSMEVTDGADQTVTVNASNASNNETVYSCIPGVVENNDTFVTVSHAERYSAMNSENRPTVSRKNGKLVITMDTGPRNEYKR